MSSGSAAAIDKCCVVQRNHAAWVPWIGWQAAPRWPTTPHLPAGLPPPLQVRIMEDRSGVVLAGIEEAIVRDSKEIFALLEQGSAKRRTAETLLNKQSSRSHSVFVVTVSVREITPEGDELIRVGKLYLVDLAGSENITRCGCGRACGQILWGVGG